VARRDRLADPRGGRLRVSVSMSGANHPSDSPAAMGVAVWITITGRVEALPKRQKSVPKKQH